MNLLDIALVDERLVIVNQLLQRHNRTDLKVVAVNKYYDFSFVCEDEHNQISYYLITDHKIRHEGAVRRDLGPNYILIDRKFEKYESVELKMGRHYTCCARYELDSYLSKGWEIETPR